MAAFHFNEQLTGKLYLLSAPLVERAITIELDAHLRKWKTRTANVTGRIRAAGIAEDAPLQGTLSLRTTNERRIPYDLSFVDDQGRTLRLRGEKDLSWLAPIETLVVLPITIGMFDRGAWCEIARGSVRDARSLRDIARSLRFAPL